MRIRDRAVRRWALPLASVAVLAACGGAPPSAPPAPAPSERPAPPPIVFSAADLVPVTLAVVATGVPIAGSLDPAEQLDVRAQIAGQLETVMAEAGQVVAKGAPLATYRTAVVEAGVSEATARLAAAQRDLDAAKLLHREGALAARELAQAQIAHDAAQAQATIAEDRLRHTRVVAPIAGTITTKLASRGEAVLAGQTLFQLVDVSRLRLDDAVAAADVGAVKIGQSVSLRIESYGARIVSGTVVHVNPVANALTRRVTVHVEVANRDHSLIGGLYAEGQVITTPPDTPQQPVVPVTAIVEEDGMASVFVVKEGKLEKRAISLGTRDDERAVQAIVAGLVAGEQVVRAPAPSLAAGVVVKVSDRGGAEADRARADRATADSADARKP